MSLNDPEVVRPQYTTETGLETRRSIYENMEGDDRREAAFQDPGDGVRCSTPMSGTDRGRRGALLERDR
jgi:hypothetical protein